MVGKLEEEIKGEGLLRIRGLAEEKKKLLKGTRDRGGPGAGACTEALLAFRTITSGRAHNHKAKCLKTWDTLSEGKE